MTEKPKNPYVGPRTFQREEKEKFFGRDREGRDLLALVVTERLVLFYAMSGAGKSSLVNTRIIPGLEDKGFEVLPVGRVSGELPPGCTAKNIYLFNLLHSLIEHEDIPDCIENLPLTDFLAGLNRDQNGYFYDESPLEPVIESTGDSQGTWPRALIIDQFEEIITTHPEAWQYRAGLFEQIAAAMQADPYLWVLLVMREDYVAALDPYAHLVPGGLRARYYMEQMDCDTALDAVKKTVEHLRPFAGGVAEKLVDDLRMVKVQAPDGTTSSQLGQYVEPVQLQVVCYRLWEKLPPGGTEITARDYDAVGDVDQALAEYYAESIRAIAAKTHVKERAIREWINNHLITSHGVRGQVPLDVDSSSGMDNEVIRELQNAHLVHSEKHGGIIWFELTHDRLVEPIRMNNDIWLKEHLSLLQRQAALWDQQHRPDGLLLRGEMLEGVQKWGEENPDEMTRLEQDFLETCRKAIENEEMMQKYLEILGKAQENKLEAHEERAAQTEVHAAAELIEERKRTIEKELEA